MVSVNNYIIWALGWDTVKIKQIPATEREKMAKINKTIRKVVAVILFGTGCATILPIAGATSLTGVAAWIGVSLSSFAIGHRFFKKDLAEAILSVIP